MTACPHCGGAAASVTPAQDGTSWAICGGCGMSYQVAASPGAAPHAAGPASGFGAPPQPRARSRRGCFGCLFAGPMSLGLFIPLLAIFCPKACASIDPAHQVALEALQACPRATATLGDDVDAAWVGMSTGESSSSANTGTANWSLAVSGSGGRGDYEFFARKEGGAWVLQSATLYAGGATIRVPSDCGGAPTSPGGSPSPGAFPGVALPSAGSGGSCDRMQRCCDVAGQQPMMEGMCRSLPSIRGMPDAEQTCGQLFGSAAQLLATRGAVPAECR